MVSTFVEALHACHRAAFFGRRTSLDVQNQGRLMSGWSVVDANLIDEIRRTRLDNWRHFENMAADISFTIWDQAIPTIQGLDSLSYLATEIDYVFCGWAVGDISQLSFCGLVTRIRLQRVSDETNT